jgi:hypothetical protein
MASIKYQFHITDFPYNLADVTRLSSEVQDSSIVTALDYINLDISYCDIWFKTNLSSGDLTTLSGIVESHSGQPPEDVDPPRMDDGRPIIRADTRPLDTATYFTCASDTVSGIGDGIELRWDFSSDSIYTTISGPYTLSCGHKIEEGWKAQVMDLKFLDPVYFKDGGIYFFDAPWGCHCDMTILVPSGTYYPNEHGSIPASALGLSGNDMYSYAAVDTPFYRYVNKHYLYGTCPMGDELNAEGCMVEALPTGWIVRGIVRTPISDNVSKGFASYEMYRHRSVILPGDTI